MYALAHADIPHLMAPQHVPVLSMGVCYSASIFTISRAGHLLINSSFIAYKVIGWLHVDHITGINSTNKI